MSFGPTRVFGSVIASGASTSSSIFLDKAYSQVFVEVGTMSTGATIVVWGSTNGTTFRPVSERVNTAPVQYQALDIQTAAVSNGGIVPLDIHYPYVQFRTAAVVSGGVSFNVICSD